jgi:hypothetical protein
MWSARIALPKGFLQAGLAANCCYYSARNLVNIEPASEISIIPIEYPAIAIEKDFLFCYYHSGVAIVYKRRGTIAGNYGHI